MHWLIVDHVRERRARKRGGDLHGTELTTALADSVPQDSGALARLHDALEAASWTDAPAAEPVDLKFFCGLSFADITALRGVSECTVQRDGNKARLILYDVLREP